MEENSKVILYVDDDADDREFLYAAFREVSPGTEVILAEDGIKALHYLNNTKNSLARMPCLIILDLNMPLLDGRQTFERIKTNPELQHIPTIIFTSGQNPKDKALFNSLGVELITKPDDISYMNKIATHMLNSCA